jgi:hypothetical protein
MSENFETCYENSLLSNTVPFDNPAFINSGLHGAVFDSIQINSWDEDYVPTLNIGTPITKNAPDQNDHFTFNLNFGTQEEMNNQSNKNGFWKYNEDKILKQLEQYIVGTYNQHYVDRTAGGTEQTLDKIKHNRREGFCAGNVTKYIDRYDTKGTPRADLFKVLHYTILLINHLDLIENK